MRPGRWLKHLALFVLLLWVSTGCYVPIRQVPSESREHFPARYGELAPGQVSRADVMLVMGEPDSASTDESTLTYRWFSIDGVIVVTQCTPPLELSSETTLTFFFDENGVLQDVNMTSS